VVPITLSSFLRSRQSEKDLLRKLADVMIVNLFPRSYVDCFLLRHALRELLTIQGSPKFNLVKSLLIDPNLGFFFFVCVALLKMKQNKRAVLEPGIAFLCDPDTLNQQIVQQLRIRQMMKKNYAYAASYDDFVSLIEDCDDLNELQQIRQAFPFTLPLHVTGICNLV